MKTAGAGTALAASLAAVGVAVLIGCIPVPVFRPSQGGPRPEEQIGAKSSGKPLRVGRSTRQDVDRILRAPQKTMSAPDADIYAYSITTVRWIVPLCFYSYPDEDGRYIRLEYGADDVLRGYKVFKTFEDARARRK